MRKYRIKPSIINRIKEVVLMIAPLLLLFIPGLNLILGGFCFYGTLLAIPVYIIIYVLNKDTKIKSLLKRSIILCIVSYFAFGTYIEYHNATTPSTKLEDQCGSIYYINK